MPGDIEKRSPLEELAQWAEQGIVTVYRGGSVDPNASYIFLRFDTVPADALLARTKMIQSVQEGKKEPGSVLGWYFPVPSIHPEQRKELEPYWVTIYEGIAIDEIATLFGDR